MKLLTIIITTALLISSSLFSETENELKNASKSYIGNLSYESQFHEYIRDGQDVKGNHSTSNSNFSTSFNVNDNKLDLNSLYVDSNSLFNLYSGLNPPDDVVNVFAQPSMFEISVGSYTSWTPDGYDTTSFTFNLTPLSTQLASQYSGLGKWYYQGDGGRGNSREDKGIMSFGENPTPSEGWKEKIQENRIYEGEIIGYDGASGQAWLYISSQKGTMTLEFSFQDKFFEQTVELTDSPHVAFSTQFEGPISGDVKGFFYGPEGSEIAGSGFFKDPQTEKYLPIGFFMVLK